jgi:hypothetical protein
MEPAFAVQAPNVGPDENSNLLSIRLLPGPAPRPVRVHCQALNTHDAEQLCFRFRTGMWSLKVTAANDKNQIYQTVRFQVFMMM